MPLEILLNLSNQNFCMMPLFDRIVTRGSCQEAFLRAPKPFLHGALMPKLLYILAFGQQRCRVGTALVYQAQQCAIQGLQQQERIVPALDQTTVILLLD